MEVVVTAHSAGQEGRRFIQVLCAGALELIFRRTNVWGTSPPDPPFAAALLVI